VLSRLLGRLLRPEGPTWYRELHRYKYQSLIEVRYETGWALSESVTSSHGWVHLGAGGLLTIQRGYCWDGPSGPTFDTHNSLRASIIHDALYQLMRERLLSLGYRRPADRILRVVAIEDGMWGWRAKLWERTVNRYAESSALPPGGDAK